MDRLSLQAAVSVVKRMTIGIEKDVAASAESLTGREYTQANILNHQPITEFASRSVLIIWHTGSTNSVQ